MTELERLKVAAAPKLAAEKADQNEKLEVCVVLLDRICTLKEQQKEGDDAFRGAWRRAKINDTRIAICLLILAHAAIYLDVIRFNSDHYIVDSIVNFFS